MKKDNIKRIRLIYGIVLSAAAVIAGICFITACVGIFLSGGEQIYTPEKVAHAFSLIAIPVYVTLALILGGFILDFLFPSERKRAKAEKNLPAILERLLAKRDTENCDSTLKEQILALRKGRKRDSILSVALLILGSIVFLLYGANPANFHQTQINASMVKAVLILFCCLAVPFGHALGAAYRAKASLQKEIDLVKGIEAGTKADIPTNKPDNAKTFMVLRCILLCAAIAILVYGFLAGGTADVLTKAVNICTECVGLG